MNLFFDALFSPYLIIAAVLLRLLIKRILHFNIEIAVGFFLYGLYLIAARFLSTTSSNTLKLVRIARDSRREAPAKPKIANAVSDLNSVYRLTGLQVVVGFDNMRRPIRVDLDRYHTLIAGTTGSGKTTILHSIIAQLVARPDFAKYYDIYLIDLKGSEKDYLEMWRPVLTGYFSIAADGSTETAIAALSSIMDKVHNSRSGKRTVVIIDELAFLTDQAPSANLRRYGDATLRRVAAQLRDRGAFIAATQRPVYEVVGRGVSSNMERKICLRVDDNNDSARLILRFRPKTDATMLRDGEFILKEPGQRNPEQIARGMLMGLPGEIDKTVYSLIEATAENDSRLKLFANIAANIKKGGQVPGVQRMRGGEWPLVELQDAYWNFVQSGALANNRIGKDGRPTQRLLAHEYPVAMGLVVQYIEQGLWKKGPRSQISEDEQGD